MAANSTAKDLRAAIGDLGFEYWVRFWRDGEKWAGPNYGSQTRAAALRERLEALGYATTMNGKPGTSGEWIIEITPKEGT